MKKSVVCALSKEKKKKKKKAPPSHTSMAGLLARSHQSMMAGTEVHTSLFPENTTRYKSGMSQHKEKGQRRFARMASGFARNRLRLKFSPDAPQCPCLHVFTNLSRHALVPPSLCRHNLLSSGFRSCGSIKRPNYALELW